MPINAHPEYLAAERGYLLAETPETKLVALEDMIRKAPKHKGSENLLAQLRLRYKKLKEGIEKTKKASKGKKGIKKEELQAVIIGLTNSGKSSLLSSLTNVNPEIAQYKFTTKKPLVGMMDYEGIQIQLIDVPAVESEYYDKGIVNSADLLVILITEISDIQKIEKFLQKFKGKKLFVFNKIDGLEKSELRKINATLASKKYNFVLISTKTKEGLAELKEKMFNSFGKLRVYTKEPGKEKSNKPIILEPGATVKEIAEKIFHNSAKIKETKIWGPSSKFPGQKIGLTHQLKDLDTIEFKTY